MDVYVTALQAGFEEAQAREITHILANFDFYNHGWTEMMEFPVDELDVHYRRYADFFEAHGITIDAPMGEFRPQKASPRPLDPGETRRTRTPLRRGAASPTTCTWRLATANWSSAAMRNLTTSTPATRPASATATEYCRSSSPFPRVAVRLAGGGDPSGSGQQIGSRWRHSWSMSRMSSAQSNSTPENRPSSSK